jgi:hypothetical protein
VLAADIVDAGHNSLLSLYRSTKDESCIPAIQTSIMRIDMKSRDKQSGALRRVATKVTFSQKWLSSCEIGYFVQIHHFNLFSHAYVASTMHLALHLNHTPQNELTHQREENWLPQDENSNSSYHHNPTN